MAGGRPRTVSFPPDDMIALGEEMIQWINDNPEILHLTQWWSIHKLFTEHEWDAMQQSPEFLPYYKRALHLVGLKYLTKESKVRDNISPRWQRVYFKDLRNSEDADLEAEADRSKKISEVTVPPLDYVRDLERKIMTLEHQLIQKETNADQSKAK